MFVGALLRKAIARSKIGGRRDVIGTLPPTDLEGGEAVDDPIEVKIGRLIIGVSLT